MANPTLCVLTSAALAIHAMGRGLTEAMGTVTKHGVKQVDRLLSNQGQCLGILRLTGRRTMGGCPNGDGRRLGLDELGADSQKAIVLSM